MFLDRNHTERFFLRVTARPALAIVTGVLVIALCAAGLSRLVKDTSLEAFIPADHPSLLANDRAKAVFGVSKPMAVAVMTSDGETVFRAEPLALIAELTERIAALPNVRRDRVSSIATESSIAGEDGTLLVERYVAESALSAEQARNAAQRWRRMPPHIGALVSEDEAGAVIMLGLKDDRQAAATYEELLALTDEYRGRSVELLVAGPGAVSGYLGAYIDRDARKLQPLVFLVVLAFVYLAFRRVTALCGALLVVVGSAGGALGLMAWSGIPYFAITNALPVILVAISVADAIHILSTYYALRAQDEQAAVRGQVVRAMTEMAPSDHADHADDHGRLHRDRAGLHHAAHHVVRVVRGSRGRARLGVLDPGPAERAGTAETRCQSGVLELAQPATRCDRQVFHRHRQRRHPATLDHAVGICPGRRHRGRGRRQAARRSLTGGQLQGG
jgi:uncharacterized protein